MRPLQLLSTPSHDASSAAGVPAMQLLTTLPATQLCIPTDAHAPTPQVLGVATKVMGSQALTVSTAALLVNGRNTDPAGGDTVTVKDAPVSVSKAFASVYVPDVAPRMGAPLRFHCKETSVPVAATLNVVLWPVVIVTPCGCC